MSVLAKVDKNVWPCEGICENDRNICRGCGRDLFERREWGEFTNEERKRRTTLIKIKGLKIERTRLGK